MSLSRVAPITAELLQRLHPIAVREPSAIQALLQRVRDAGLQLRRGLNRQILPERARILRLESDRIVLATEHFEERSTGPLVLNFELEGQPYSFLTQAKSHANSTGSFEVEIPSVVHHFERRERARRDLRSESTAGWRAVVLGPRGEPIQAEIENVSAGGLGLRVSSQCPLREGSDLSVRFLDGDRAGREAVGLVKSRVDLEGEPGWARIGVSVRPALPSSGLEPEMRERVLPGSAIQQVWRDWRIVGHGVGAAARRTARRLAGRRALHPQIRVVRYANAAGERLAGIVDSHGDPAGATAVVIAPAWGRTKETLLPLARTIVATFRAARLPVIVVRFDGVRGRGESHHDPECRTPGAELHHFVLSQGVQDIVATLDFLDREHRPARRILVTFSAAAMVGRTAVARDARDRLAGWVSVVGTADLQGAMRVISGGVDYLGGAEQGVRFGLQEVLGLEVDMDRVAEDAIRNRMAFLDDARRDCASIEAPITWFHGKHDAWMSLERVRDVMSHGPSDRRRLVVIPTGHQLASSREALEVFQCVASEIGRMAIGREIPLTLPDLADVEARRGAERARLPKRPVDLRAFWKDYLVGRDGLLGIEIMTAASVYQDLMSQQVLALGLTDGARIADLGSGTGALPLQLVQMADHPKDLEIYQLDFVGEALRRMRHRLGSVNGSPAPNVRAVQCNLDLGRGLRTVPLRSGRFDAVLASLLLSYVDDPETLLREASRLLRPRGRLVVSTLRKDADISKIHVGILEELRAGLTRGVFDDEERRNLEPALQSLLNDAARLLDLEEQGAFRFWEREDLTELVRRAGFTDVATRFAFGDPPQAIILSASRL